MKPSNLRILVQHIASTLPTDLHKRHELLLAATDVLPRCEDTEGLYKALDYLSRHELVNRELRNGEIHATTA